VTPDHPQVKPLNKSAALILDESGPVTCERLRPAVRQVLFCAYTGNSMSPTLDPSDLLEVRPGGERFPQLGDVVLCVPPGGKRAVVHRVVRMGPDGIATRGDNNAVEDAWRLGEEDIAGRIVAAWRGERRRTIAGGRAGRRWARWVRATRSLDRMASGVLHPLVRTLERSRVLWNLLPAKARPQLVAFEAADGVRWRLVFRRREVGRFDREAGRWLICRPFRLLVDERMLPEDRTTRNADLPPTAHVPSEPVP
jgi:hypothetical protein